LHRLAKGHRDGERFFLGIRRFDHACVLQRRRHLRRGAGVGGIRAPFLGCVRGAQRLRDQPFTAARGNQGDYRVALYPHADQQRLHCELRMSRRRSHALAFVACN